VIHRASSLRHGDDDGWREDGRHVAPSDPLAFCAADFGFTRNSSAAAIAVPVGDLVHLVTWIEWRPGGAPLVPSAVYRGVADLALAHGCAGVCADGHTKENAREVFAPAGLAFFDAPTVPAVAVLEVRRLLQESRIRGIACDGEIVGALRPDEHVGLLRRQLEAVKIEHVNGGHVRVTMPQTKDGRHGDVAAACILALYRASRAKPYARPIGATLARA
jgi:hypothetical protein